MIEGQPLGPWVGRPPPPVSPVERLAKAVVRRGDRPRRNTSVGPANALVTFGFRLLPPVYDRLVTPLVKLAVLSKELAAPTAGNVFGPPDRHPVEAAPD